ncbi:MAG: phospholipid carrier-dependent glycosyltransferase [bacterium]|nr:phospholipid carrier-dependent glycosyltransferase [bacterium]
MAIEHYCQKALAFFLKPKTILFILSLSLLYFFFYTFNLNSLPVFADEAIYIRWAQLIKNVPTLRFVPLQDGKQPLFMWILAGLLKFKLDPLFTGRALSVIFGFGLVVGLSFLITQLLTTGKLKSRLSFNIFSLSALILTFLPFTFFFARLSLVDMMLAFFYTAAIYLFLIWWRYPRLDTAIITGFVIGLAWLTKSPGLILLSLTSAWMLIKIVQTKKIKLAGHLIAAALTANLVYGILRLSANYHMIASRNKDYLFPLSKFLSTPLDPLIPHLKDVFHFYWFYFTPIGLILILLGLIWFFKNKEFKNLPNLIFISFIIAPFFFTLIFAQVFTARYLLYFSLPLVYFIVYPIHKLNYSKLSLIPILALIIWGGFYNLTLATNPAKAPLPYQEYKGYLTDWTAGWGIKESANFFKQQAQKQPVVIGTEGYFGTMPDGLWIYLDQTSNINILGGPVPVSQTPQSLIDSAKAGNLTYLVAHKSRFLIPEDKVQNQLKLIKTYTKPADPATNKADSLLIWQVKPIN